MEYLIKLQYLMAMFDFEQLLNTFTKFHALLQSAQWSPSVV